MENRDRDFLPVEDHANEAAVAAAGLRVGADDLYLESPDSSLVSVILPVAAPGPALPISWEWTPPSIPPRSIVTPSRAVATLMQLSRAPPLNAGTFSIEVVLDASLSHTATTNVVQWPRRRISYRDLHRIAQRNRIRALKAAQWSPGTQCPDAPASSSTSQRYGDLTSRRDWHFAFRPRNSRPIRHRVNNQLQRPNANYIYRSSRPVDQPRIVTPQQHQKEDPARQQRDQQHYIDWHWSRRPHPTWAQSLPDSWQHAEWQPQRRHHDVELRGEPAVLEAGWGWSMFGMRQRHHHVILVESGWYTLQNHLLVESQWDRPQPVQQPASWPPLESDSAAVVADSQDEISANQASDGELDNVHNDDP